MIAFLLIISDNSMSKYDNFKSKRRIENFSDLSTGYYYHHLLSFKFK
jgi:hypothetical protein